MKLVFVSAHPAPYRDPFLRRLVRRHDIETKILSLYDDDNGHAFWDLDTRGYDTEVIGVRGTHWMRMFWRLLTRCVFGGYDVICWPGFHRPETKWAMVICALLGRPYGFCADSIAQPKRNGILMFVKRFIVRRARFIFSPGNATKHFFIREFNYPENQICSGAYALEGGEIERNILGLRSNAVPSIRKRFGIEEDAVVFLMVANMLQTRHYPITAKAFCRFSEKIGRIAHENGKNPQHVRFVMVGKGHDQEQMENMAKTCPELVVIPGVSFAEMQELYALADVYVHGGTEPASTALVIGAIAHLPLMSSPAVGCSADVVRDGESGILVQNYLSEKEWVNAFLKIWDAKAKWAQFGERAREFSRVIDCENVVDGFVERVKKACVA